MSKKFSHHNMTVPPGLVREEIRNGRQMLVVPVVMLREQVLVCSNCDPGGEYVSASEIAQSAIAWDNRPVTLSHPTEPWTPTNHQNLEVGRIFNVHFQGTALKGEMWLDVLKLRGSEEGRVAEQRFRKGEVTEVSTGYFAERSARNGSFNNTPYVAEHAGLIPDHLAILVNEIGACSIEGGCGAPRLNSAKEQETNDMDEHKKLLARIAEFLMGTKPEDEGEAVSDDGTGDDSAEGAADDGTGAVENSEGDTLDSTTDEGEGADGGEETPDGSESNMDRKELVQRILNSGKVESFTEEALTAMSDDQLTALAQLAGCGCADRMDNADGEGATDNEGEGAGDSSEPTVDFSAEDATFVAELRALSGGSAEGLAALVEAGKAEAARRETSKDALVNSLSKDARVALSKTILSGMPLEALEGIDRTINPTSYAGQGGPRIVENADEEGFAPAPPAVFLGDNQEG